MHALLHIADSIEASGPMWAYWAFPMERYCGSLTPAIQSRRFPFPSIDRHIVELAQLTQIKMVHQLHDVLSLKASMHGVAGQFSDPQCKHSGGLMAQIHLTAYMADPTYMLLPPCNRSAILPSLAGKIATSLSTLFNLPVNEIRPRLRKATLKQYGKVQRLDGGDTMNASRLVPVSDGLRDATFVRISFGFRLLWILPPYIVVSLKCQSTRMHVTQSGRWCSNRRSFLASYNIYSWLASRRLRRLASASQQRLS
jgi:hypothetical protein